MSLTPYRSYIFLKQFVDSEVDNLNSTVTCVLSASTPCLGCSPTCLSQA